MGRDIAEKIVSVCVWRSYPYAKRLYVALSQDGVVDMVGPSGVPHITEVIQNAGLEKPWSGDHGYLNAIREIGSCLIRMRG